MNRSLSSLARRRSARIAIGAAAAALVVLALALSGAAGSHRVPPPPVHPTSVDQIQNLDQVKTAIYVYYGNSTDPSRVSPIDGMPLQTFSDDGPYANEVEGVVDSAQRYLRKSQALKVPAGTTRSVLFDVDDTTLSTFSYQTYANFVFNATSNAAFANAAIFQAVPHMVELEHFAESLGYTVFFLTGRNILQHDGTLTNLTNEGYDVIDANLYLKDNTAPWLSSCAPTCATTQYKSLTRQHIESLGYHIVANFGDQFSDLNGGFADKTFKIPNPMYFLP